MPWRRLSDSRVRLRPSLSPMFQLWATLFLSALAMVLGVMVGCPIWTQPKLPDRVVESVWARSGHTWELSFAVAVLLITVGLFCFVRGLTFLVNGGLGPTRRSLPRTRRRKMAALGSALEPTRCLALEPLIKEHTHTLTLTDQLAVAKIETTELLG